MGILEIKKILAECDLCFLEKKFEIMSFCGVPVPPDWKILHYTTEGSHGRDRHHSLYACEDHSKADLKKEVPEDAFDVTITISK